MICSGGLSSRSPPKRSQRKHWLSTSVKRRILTRAILPFSARNDTHDVVGQRSLQFEGLRRISQQPQIHLLRRRQDDRHCLGMDRGDDGVRLCREQAEQLVLPIH